MTPTYKRNWPWKENTYNNMSWFIKDILVHYHWYCLGKGCDGNFFSITITKCEKRACNKGANTAIFICGWCYFPYIPLCSALCWNSLKNMLVCISMKCNKCRRMTFLIWLAQCYILCITGLAFFSVSSVNVGVRMVKVPVWADSVHAGLGHQYMKGLTFAIKCLRLFQRLGN